VQAPEWIAKGSLPQWVFQATGLGLLVFVVIRRVDTDLAVLLPAILSVAGIAAFARFAGRPHAEDNGGK
jgi:hypothetical protein